MAPAATTGTTCCTDPPRRGDARAGRAPCIYRKGKPVDPEDFKGVYRLGLPRRD